MNRLLKTAVLSIAAASVAMMPVANAWADHRIKRHHRHHQRPVVVERHNNSGELLAAGIIGLALGAIIVGAANQPYVKDSRHPPRPRPDRQYFPPEPDDIVDEPRVIYAQPHAMTAEPWSREWLRYCRARFRSFDEESGTYLGYDGRRHFCVAK